MAQVRALQTISQDGTAVLEDGTEVQLVLAANGALGAKPLKREDVAAKLDQVGPPAANHFDISALDQS
jgi:antitoxin component of MazEF toxin-antitoxin module